MDRKRSQTEGAPWIRGIRGSGWSYLWVKPRAMKLNELKVALAKQILESENESELRSVDMVLNQGFDFQLSDEQKAQLDAAHSRYLRGEGKSYTSTQMVRRVRKAVR